jgi:hypothetical protein
MNGGPQVEWYQKTVDGKAQREPWCLAFIQTMAFEISAQYNLKNPLFPTEHCLTLWNKTPQKYKSMLPSLGSVFIQQYIGTTNGHTGVVIEFNKEYFKTIEGNTNKDGSREGDGVYEKIRFYTDTTKVKKKGFIDLPQMILDLL